MWRPEPARLCLLSMLPALALACSPSLPPLGQGFEDGLTDFAGCCAVEVWGLDEGRTMSLVVQLYTNDGQVIISGDEVIGGQWTADLATGDGYVTIQHGGFVDPADWQFHTDWDTEWEEFFLANEGLVTTTVTAAEDWIGEEPRFADFAVAEVRLEGVVFENRMGDGLEELVIEDYAFPPIGVGTPWPE